MSAFDELKQILAEKTDKCANVAMSHATARARVIVSKEIETFLRKKGKWDTASKKTPNFYFTITNENDIVKIHLTDELKALLS